MSRISLKHEDLEDNQAASITQKSDRAVQELREFKTRLNSVESDEPRTRLQLVQCRRELGGSVTKLVTCKGGAIHTDHFNSVIPS